MPRLKVHRLGERRERLRKAALLYQLIRLHASQTKGGDARVIADFSWDEVAGLP